MGTVILEGHLDLEAGLVGKAGVTGAVTPGGNRALKWATLFRTRCNLLCLSFLLSIPANGLSLLKGYPIQRVDLEETKLDLNKSQPTPLTGGRAW